MVAAAVIAAATVVAVAAVAEDEAAGNGLEFKRLGRWLSQLRAGIRCYAFERVRGPRIDASHPPM